MHPASKLHRALLLAPDLLLPGSFIHTTLTGLDMDCKLREISKLVCPVVTFSSVPTAEEEASKHIPDILSDLEMSPDYFLNRPHWCWKTGLFIGAWDLLTPATCLYDMGLMIVRVSCDCILETIHKFQMRFGSPVFAM